MNSKASQIVDAMMDKDLYSQWLGIEILERGQGHCRLRMVARPEMCNGFGIVHGGISFSFADSALAFACNSRGRHAVSIECSISHIRPIQVGDILIAVAKEQNLGNRTAIYEVRVEKEGGDLVALFKGTVFRKDKEWEVLP